MKFLSALLFLATFLTSSSFACEVDTDCGIDPGWTCERPFRPGDTHDISYCTWSAPAPTPSPEAVLFSGGFVTQYSCNGGRTCSTDADCGADGWCAPPWSWGGPIYSCFCK